MLTPLCFAGRADVAAGDGIFAPPIHPCLSTSKHIAGLRGIEVGDDRIVVEGDGAITEPPSSTVPAAFQPTSAVKPGCRPRTSIADRNMRDVRMASAMTD